MYGDRDVLPASFPPATPFSPATTHSSFTTIGGSYGFETPERIYAYRPAMPPTAEENSEQLLDKLEQAGRVPSKEKFRRMACNVSKLFNYKYMKCRIAALFIVAICYGNIDIYIHRSVSLQR